MPNTLPLRTTAYCLAATLLLGACVSTAMKTDDVRHLRSDCSNVNSQIAMLETERKDNDKRLKAGVTSILPISAAANLINGSYGTNAEVATGEWSDAVHAKLKELYTLKAQCRQQGIQTR